jgi:hypothetical protein
MRRPGWSATTCCQHNRRTRWVPGTHIVNVLNSARRYKTGWSSITSWHYMISTSSPLSQKWHGSLIHARVQHFRMLPSCFRIRIPPLRVVFALAQGHYKYTVYSTASLKRKNNLWTWEFAWVICFAYEKFYIVLLTRMVQSFLCGKTKSFDIMHILFFRTVYMIGHGPATVLVYWTN